MVCFTCKGDVKKSTTAYMTEIDSCYIIIKNVPCTKCSQCGEEYLNGRTMQKIETIIAKMKNMLTELAIIDFTKAA